MQLINFDDHFQDFLADWFKENNQAYSNLEAMEAEMPNVYLDFLNTPADWLDGIIPGAYFTQFEDPKRLVDWLVAYTVEEVPVPDLLLEQIVQVGKPCEKRLVALLKDSETNIPAEARMIAITLLREMESTQPKMLYIQMQQMREPEDDLADQAMESLTAMGQVVVQPILAVLDRATPAGQEAFLEVLSHFPSSEKIFQLALRLFQENPKRTALFAAYLGRLGDDRALPALMARIQAEKLTYHDYIDLRSAIESLGGEAPERIFPGKTAATPRQRKH